MGERLSRNELEALEECARYSRSNRCYWWRVASMKKLEARGLVETYTPPSVAERPRMKARPYRLTESGHDYLRGFPQ